MLNRGQTTRLLGDPSGICQTFPMNLNELGLDRGLAEEARTLCGPDLSIARVTAVDRGRYLIRGEGGEVPAELTGRFLHLAESSAELPCVGDWVWKR